MSKEPYKVIDLVLQADARETLAVSAAVLAILEADNDFRLGFDDGDTHYVVAGLEITTAGFTKVHLENPYGVPLNMKLAVSQSGVRDARLQVTADLGIATAANLQTVDDAALVAGVATLILAANANRKEAMVTNLSANASVIRVGDASVGTARGIEIAPGQTATFSTRAAVYGYSVSAQSVGVAEVVK